MTDAAPGSLTVAGVGTTAVAHMTLEAIGHVREADVVLHNVNEIAAHHLGTLNPRCVSLQRFYAPRKDRAATYFQMTEVILREVRAGRRVVAITGGHPCVLSTVLRNAVSVAKSEGHAVKVLAGVSSVDALMADLPVHLGSRGFQILEASALVLRNQMVATDGHLILLMASRLGEIDAPSPGMAVTPKLPVLFERLVDLYGPSHPCVVYRGADAPTVEADVRHVTLGDGLLAEKQRDWPAHFTLYVPPLIKRLIDPKAADRVGVGAAVGSNTRVRQRADVKGPAERAALEEIEDLMREDGETDAAGEGAVFGELEFRIVRKLVDSPAFARTSPWLKQVPGRARTSITEED